jgi:hypothetical protein
MTLAKATSLIHNLRYGRFLLQKALGRFRRQEHFRQTAEGIVPQVNGAIALARRLDLPIYYSQHGQKCLPSQ